MISYYFLCRFSISNELLRLSIWLSVDRTMNYHQENLLSQTNVYAPASTKIDPRGRDIVINSTGIAHSAIRWPCRHKPTRLLIVPEGKARVRV